jgi:hypothetical protein
VTFCDRCNKQVLATHLHCGSCGALFYGIRSLGQHKRIHSKGMGTTFTLDQDITLKIKELQKLRMDTTTSQTIRFLILLGLQRRNHGLEAPLLKDSEANR